MKQIINFILTGVVLYLAAVFFPKYVWIADTKTLILATLLLFVAEVLVVIFIFVMMAISLFSGNIAGVVTSIFAIFFAEIFAITLVSAWLPGLTIEGFWTKFVLAVALSIFRIPTGNNNDD